MTKEENGAQFRGLNTLFGKKCANLEPRYPTESVSNPFLPIWGHLVPCYQHPNKAKINFFSRPELKIAVFLLERSLDNSYGLSYFLNPSKIQHDASNSD